MNHQHLMKWTLLFALLMLELNSSRAGWSIGAKAQINGPIVHSIYFITPNNAPVSVTAQAYVGTSVPTTNTGTSVNSNCPYTAVYQLGTEILKTGDVFYVDAYQLKNLINGGYNCISIYYTYQQLVIDNFQLLYDGFNYVSSYPSREEVVIL